LIDEKVFSILFVFVIIWPILFPSLFKYRLRFQWWCWLPQTTEVLCHIRIPGTELWKGCRRNKQNGYN